MIAEASSYDRNTDRARVYRALARLFLPPDPERVEALRTRDLPDLRRALQRLDADAAILASAGELSRRIPACDATALGKSYDLSFDASAGLRCPVNETSVVADTPSEQMTKTYTLADVAGFYRAFGVEVSPGSEQPDHIAVELEFMHLLAVKEALAQEEPSGAEHAAICRDAASSFLRDHLGRFAARFGQQVEEVAADPVYAAAGRLLAGFVALESRAIGADAPGERRGDETWGAYGREA